MPELPGEGPVRFFYAPDGTDDLAPGQYVASGGQWLESSYASGHTNGVFYRNSRIGLADINDGTSLTFMVGERSRNLAEASWVGALTGGSVCTNPSWSVRECVPDSPLVLGYTLHEGPSIGTWEYKGPNATTADAFDFWSLHPGGCNFLFADGSVRFLKQTIDPRTFRRPVDSQWRRGHRGRCVLSGCTRRCAPDLMGCAVSTGNRPGPALGARSAAQSQRIKENSPQRHRGHREESRHLARIDDLLAERDFQIGVERSAEEQAIEPGDPRRRMHSPRSSSRLVPPIVPRPPGSIPRRGSARSTFSVLLLRTTRPATAGRAGPDPT